MNAKTYAELKVIAEKLAVVVIMDANPENWDAAGLAPAKMNNTQRGNAYWSRKLAAQSLTVLTKVSTILGMIERHGPDDVDVTPADDLGAAEAAALKKQIANARRDATRMLAIVAERERAGE